MKKLFFLIFGQVCHFPFLGISNGEEMQNFKSTSLINTMQVYAVEVMYCVAS